MTKIQEIQEKLREDGSSYARVSDWRLHFSATIHAPVRVRIAKYSHSRRYKGFARFKPGLNYVSFEVWSVDKSPVVVALISIFRDTGERDQLRLLTRGGHYLVEPFSFEFDLMVSGAAETRAREVERQEEATREKCTCTCTCSKCARK